MSRLNRLALLTRAAVHHHSAAATRHVIRPALLHTTATKFICPEQWNRSTIGGARLFSAATSAMTEEEEVGEEMRLKKGLMPKDVVLYQYEACPFCNKVKEIIDKLFQKIHPEISTDPASANEEERKWLEWVDNHLVHVLSPNIYRSVSEALESFDYITTHGNFSLTERIFAKYAGATAMYFVSKKLKKRHNITDERKALYEAAETWVEALKGRNFLGGTKPNLADLAVFGVLRPIRNLKSGRDMVENTHIGDWYKSMESAVGESSKIKA